MMTQQTVTIRQIYINLQQIT